MRSPLTETIYRVQGMISYVRENLSTDEFMLFLDLLVPEPEPEVAKPAKKKRKPRTATKSSRAASLAEQIKSTGKVARCTYEIDDNGGLTPCDAIATDLIHDKNAGYLGYHEFQPAQAAAATGD